jgi:hypothetical protein
MFILLEEQPRTSLPSTFSLSPEDVDAQGHDFLVIDGLEDFY